MRFKNLIAQLAFRAVWVLVAITATVYTFTDYIVAAGGDNKPTALFFTSWSVWFASIVAILIFASNLAKVIKGEKQGYNTMVPLLKFCATIMIIATFIVAAFVLPNKLWTGGYWSNPGSIFKHFLLPILTVLDCVLFDDSNKIRKSYPFLATIAPLLYWTILLVRVAIFRSNYGGNIPKDLYDFYYPYSFTNIDAGKSWGGLIGMLAGILCGLILIGFAFYAIDKLKKDNNNKITFDNTIDEENLHDIIHLIKQDKKIN